jgi:hypothetical protein
MNFEQVIISDAELKANIENKLNRSLSINSNMHVIYQFDQLSTLDTLFDHLKPLIHNQSPLTDESIKKTSHLLIDSFITWYRSISFYSLLNPTLNQFILNNRWSKYIFLVICHFLTKNYNHKTFISYEQCVQRLFEYQQRNFLSAASHKILEEFLHFLSQLFNLHLTNPEFTLLSILLVIQHGKK